MKKNLFLLPIICVASLLTPLYGEALDPYAPKKGATWCDQPTNQVEQKAQASQKAQVKTTKKNKLVLVITSVAVIAICAVLGSLASTNQPGPTS